MKIKELNTKINIVIGLGLLLFLSIAIVASLQDNGLQKQIDENKCIMGGSCPEINSILPNRIVEVLQRDGLKLSCAEYEQIEVLRYNITCNTCTFWYSSSCWK